MIGESEIASKVASESEAEGEEARKFLEDVRVTFPQVCLEDEKESSFRAWQYSNLSFVSKTFFRFCVL